ncbi:MAG TPA: SLBB domain-containing protein, partial [Gemmatimonadales bacterium]|nr:SLBB domain-containing protein [Gemmatimonadales bacterium]
MQTLPRLLCRVFPLILLLLGSAALPAVGQVPTKPPPQPLPSQTQIQQTLQQQPELARRLREKIGASGLTDDQIRARLRAAGYPDSLLDQYLPSTTDTLNITNPTGNTLTAVQQLGILGGEEAESLLVLTDSARMIADSLRRDSLAAPDTSLKVFGMEIFQRATNLFQPALAGPVDQNYRLGPGDELVLILTGDVELAHDLVVSREGSIAIPQVGQINVANLTMDQLEDLLYTRLGKVYSGVRRSPNATTKFTVTVARLRTIQIFVTGDVHWPGSYQISAAGTVLNALYEAGGPTVNGSFRRVEVHRKGKMADSLDIYDYLLRGDASHDIRLETGDVIFVPVRKTPVKMTGRVVRPAIYELLPGETLRDLIHSAGGFDPTALRRRVQIDRILPPQERTTDGKDRVVLDIPASEFEGDEAPAFRMEPGDSVVVFPVSDLRRNMVEVRGAVWVEGLVGYRPGMKLSDAIRLAGGLKPDFYPGRVLVSRLQPDSTRIQLRANFSDSTGALLEDLALMEYDQILVFSRTSFRPERYVAITGAVRRPGQLPFREGMTLRDAILQADGMTEDASISEAEVARLPSDQDREGGRVASAMRVPMDSTYLFERTSVGKYLGPPGRPAPSSGAPEFELLPYDNILVFRQPDWELQRTVAITGAVVYPGRYSLQTRTDRLTDLIARAGGLTKAAYPQGVTFVRQIDRGGRIGVDLPAALKDPQDLDNLILAGGDSIFIPEYNPVVYVRGSVNAPMSVAYVPGKDMDFYVGAAGGFAQKADGGRSYVTQPNGKVESVKRRFLFADGKPTPMAGAVVFVPEKIPTPPKETAATLGALAAILASLTT